MLRIAEHKMDLGRRIAGCGVPFLGHFQHTLDKIQADDCRAAPREASRDVAGAAAQVQRARSRMRGSHFDHSPLPIPVQADRKSTRLNSSHANISYAVFCLKKKKQT